MKKIIYAILACVIIAGAIIIPTIGLKADIIYSKNVEIDIYLGKTIKAEEIKALAKEVFQNERMLVQEIELFNDMISITIPEKTDEELKEQIEQLNAKLNEKYEVENTVEQSISIKHNPKIRLSSILKPYILPIIISIIITLIYVAIRYKKLGSLNIIWNYVLNIGIVEATYLGVLAITRFPINRLVVPIGLLLYVGAITVLGFINENKLSKAIITENKTK